jgi:phosphopantetheine--protein transferase-like protein
MYSQLSAEGFAAENYADIKTYGQLLTALNKTGSSIPVTPVIANEYDGSSEEGNSSIGIDIESISAMPQATDFREAAFYQMNFSAAEIAYCILQSDPLASFAGLFAAKEAIIKADNIYQNKNFNTIFIDHLPNGKPVHPGFQLSISHTGETAIAVAVKNTPPSSTGNSTLISPATGNSTLITFAAVAAFLLSLLSLLLLFIKRS